VDRSRWWRNVCLVVAGFAIGSELLGSIAAVLGGVVLIPIWFIWTGSLVRSGEVAQEQGTFGGAGKQLRRGRSCFRMRGIPILAEACRARRCRRPRRREDLHRKRCGVFGVSGESGHRTIGVCRQGLVPGATRDATCQNGDGGLCLSCAASWRAHRLKWKPTGCPVLPGR
jgi:hypothetical protein